LPIAIFDDVVTEEKIPVLCSGELDSGSYDVLLPAEEKRGLAFLTKCI
jgi:hypothetical protein